MPDGKSPIVHEVMFYNDRVLLVGRNFSSGNTTEFLILKTHDDGNITGFVQSLKSSTGEILNFNYDSLEIHFRHNFANDRKNLGS